MKCCIGDY